MDNQYVVSSRKRKRGQRRPFWLLIALVGLIAIIAMGIVFLSSRGGESGTPSLGPTSTPTDTFAQTRVPPCGRIEELTGMAQRGLSFGVLQVPSQWDLHTALEIGHELGYQGEDPKQAAEFALGYLEVWSNLYGCEIQNQWLYHLRGGYTGIDLIKAFAEGEFWQQGIDVAYDVFDITPTPMVEMTPTPIVILTETTIPTATQLPVMVTLEVPAASSFYNLLSANIPSTYPALPEQDPSGLTADCQRMRSNLDKNVVQNPNEAGFLASLILAEDCHGPSLLPIDALHDLLEEVNIPARAINMAQVVESVFTCELATAHLQASQRPEYWDLGGLQRQSVNIALGALRGFSLANGCPQ